MADSEHPERANVRRSIRAAEALFKRIGFRAVTMEAVARDANISKVTLYSYFRNKDELFLAVCQRMAELLRSAVEAALTPADAPLDTRIARAVIAKHRMVFTLVRGSAHAAELFSSKDAIAGDVFAALDVAVLTLLERAIAADPQLSRRAERLARALYFGCADLAARGSSAAAMQDDLEDFVAVHVAGARALSRQEDAS